MLTNHAYMQYRAEVEDILQRPTTYLEQQRIRNAFGNDISPSGCAMSLRRAWHHKPDALTKRRRVGARV